MKPMSANRGGLTREDLRLLAAVSMLIDHADAALLDWGMRYRLWLATSELAVRASTVLHCVGRFAFPLYIFLLVEGFFHTRDRTRYLGRVVLLAVVSEAPFDLALMLWRSELNRGILVEASHQNVLFTLALGFVAIWSLEELKALRQAERTGLVSGLCTVAGFLAVGTCCFAALGFSTDYSWQGVLAIVVAYLVHDVGKPALAGVATSLTLALYSPYELCGLACCPVLAAFDGSRGKPLLGKWFNYAFYPGHLLILGLLRLAFVM